MDSTSITVEAIIRWDGSTQQFIATRWTGALTRPWLLYVTTAGKLTAQIDNGGVLVGGGTTLSSSVASHVALVCDNSTVKVYVNGNVDGSASHGGPTQSGADLEIARASSVSYTTLAIDEFAFYTHALSATRTAAHAAAR
jgi:hypothetical protein